MNYRTMLMGIGLGLALGPASAGDPFAYCAAHRAVVEAMARSRDAGAAEADARQRWRDRPAPAELHALWDSNLTLVYAWRDRPPAALGADLEAWCRTTLAPPR